LVTFTASESITANAIDWDVVAGANVDEINITNNGTLDILVTGEDADINLNKDYLSSADIQDGLGSGDIQIITELGNLDVNNMNFYAAASYLKIAAQGIFGTVKTTVEKVAILTLGSELADIIILEYDDLVIEGTDFNNDGILTGLNSSSGQIDITLVTLSSVLTLNTGSIKTSSINKDINIIADDIDFKAGIDTIIGTGVLNITTITQDDYLYNLGTAAEEQFEFIDLTESEFKVNNSINLSSRDLAALADGFSLIKIGHREGTISMVFGDIEGSASFKDIVEFRADTIRVRGDVNQIGNNQIRFYGENITVEAKNIYDPQGASDSGITAYDILFEIDESMQVGGWIRSTNSVTITVSSVIAAISLRTDVGSTIEISSPSSFIDIDTTKSIEMAGIVESLGLDAIIKINTGNNQDQYW